MLRLSTLILMGIVKQSVGSEARKRPFFYWISAVQSYGPYCDRTSLFSGVSNEVSTGPTLRTLKFLLFGHRCAMWPGSPQYIQSPF